MFKLGVILKHHADAPLLWRQENIFCRIKPGALLTLDFTTAGFFQPGENA